jgi:hypothetical protein
VRPSIGYAMKLVEGKTLRVLLTETAELYKAGKPIDAEHSLPTRLEHFLKICDAVAFAHDRRIIHRDLKPSNFMIGKFGEVYVMDWGIARPIGAGPEAPSPSRKASGRDADLTQDGEIVGSASYMSPEQAEGRNQELDARADQYALGLILFELVSLRRAIEGASTVEVFTKASRGAKGPLEHVSKNERIPAELRAIVDKATAFSPDQRYPSVAALADDLRSYLRGEAVTARPDNALGKLLRWMNRHRRTTLVTVVVALALAASAVAWSLYRRTADQLAARELADKQTALYGDVATQAHAIDSQFQQMEEALEGLRAAAEWALAAPHAARRSGAHLPRHRLRGSGASAQGLHQPDRVPLAGLTQPSGRRHRARDRPGRDDADHPQALASASPPAGDVRRRHRRQRAAHPGAAQRADTAAT